METFKGLLFVCPRGGSQKVPVYVVGIAFSSAGYFASSACYFASSAGVKARLRRGAWVFFYCFLARRCVCSGVCVWYCCWVYWDTCVRQNIIYWSERLDDLHIPEIRSRGRLLTATAVTRRGCFEKASSNFLPSLDFFFFFCVRLCATLFEGIYSIKSGIPTECPRREPHSILPYSR